VGAGRDVRDQEESGLTTGGKSILGRRDGLCMCSNARKTFGFVLRDQRADSVAVTGPKVRGRVAWRRREIPSSRAILQAAQLWEGLQGEGREGGRGI
jgi:hypothetical protein